MDPTCLICAFLFFSGNVLLIVYTILEFQERRVNGADFRMLDVEYIEQIWKFRREWEGFEIAAGLINALAWFLFTIPITQLAWILSLGGRRKLWMHVAIAGICMCTSLSEFIARLFQIGSSNVMEWMTSYFNLSSWLQDGKDDNVGWRVVEVVYVIYNGLMLWVDSFEWLAIFLMLTLIYASTRSLMVVQENRPTFTFGRCWAHLGLFIGLLSLVDFAVTCARFINWRYFTRVSMFFSVLNRLVLLPLWLCLFSRELYVAATSVEITKQYGGHHPSTEMTPYPSSLETGQAM